MPHNPLRTRRLKDDEEPDRAWGESGAQAQEVVLVGCQVVE